jgi:hypothetical protein
MNAGRLSVAAIATFGLFAVSLAQEPALPKPGPEHELLHKMVGEWDVEMEMGGQKFKCGSSTKAELGGLWVVSEFKGNFGGLAFTGKGIDGYDPATGKYSSIWIDSMSTRASTFTGEYDAAKKRLTMTGEGPAQAGPGTQKLKSVTTFADDDHFTFEMFSVVDGKDVSMLVAKYSRRAAVAKPRAGAAPEASES